MGKQFLILALLFSASSFALTCKTEGGAEKIVLSIVDTQPGKDYFEDETYVAKVQVSELNGAAVNKAFVARGTHGMMAAGYVIELANAAEGFRFEDGMNGSELNGWVIPTKVVYQGTEFSVCE